MNEVFMDHTSLSLSIRLQVPEKQTFVHRWPRPAQLPWSDLTLENWQPQCAVQFHAGENATTFIQQWAHDCEHQIFQHARQTGDCKIRNRCRGRAQRLQPVRQQLAKPTCRASREGEVQATCSMIGTATRHWFRRLRRLQSLDHAVKASKNRS